jgi:signal transduction histidine kinase
MSVDDNGPGIAAGMEEKVFEKFFRADNSMTRESSGAGIGLSLVRHIAQAHGGTAKIFRPADGTGTIATIFIPAKS